MDCGAWEAEGLTSTCALPSCTVPGTEPQTLTFVDLMAALTAAKEQTTGALFQSWVAHDFCPLLDRSRWGVSDMRKTVQFLLQGKKIINILRYLQKNAQPKIEK